MYDRMLINKEVTVQCNLSDERKYLGGLEP